MNSGESIKIRMSELPKRLELIGPNGEIIPFALMPKKGEVGVYLNKISNQLLKLIGKK